MLELALLADRCLGSSPALLELGGSLLLELGGRLLLELGGRLLLELGGRMLLELGGRLLPGLVLGLSRGLLLETRNSLTTGLGNYWLLGQSSSLLQELRWCLLLLEQWR